MYGCWAVRTRERIFRRGSGSSSPQQTKELIVSRRSLPLHPWRPLLPIWFAILCSLLTYSYFYLPLGNPLLACFWVPLLLFFCFSTLHEFTLTSTWLFYSPLSFLLAPSISLFVSHFLFSHVQIWPCDPVCVHLSSALPLLTPSRPLLS